MTELTERILAGDARAIARAATLIENRCTGCEELLRVLFPRSGRASILGVTGAPGAGKSTFVDQITRELRKGSQSVGILAIDPTSPFSGGAILGDRIRMQQHHADAGVFIRSMATRGSLGGLAGATADLALLLDAAGFDWVIVETVGVGQAEVDIARTAQATIVLLTPGTGDDVQALKAGIMEIADVFVINKADLAGAAKLEREVLASLELAQRADGWTPPVVRAVASEGSGIAEALRAVRQFLESVSRQDRAVENWKLRLAEMLRDRVTESIDGAALERAARRVARFERDPYTVAGEWFEAFKNIWE